MWRNGKRHGKGILKIPGLDEMLNWEWKNDVPVQKRWYSDEYKKEKDILYLFICVYINLK